MIQQPPSRRYFLDLSPSAAKTDSSQPLAEMILADGDGAVEMPVLLDANDCRRITAQAITFLADHDDAISSEIRERYLRPCEIGEARWKWVSPSHTQGETAVAPPACKELLRITIKYGGEFEELGVVAGYRAAGRTILITRPVTGTLNSNWTMLEFRFDQLDEIDDRSECYLPRALWARFLKSRSGNFRVPRRRDPWKKLGIAELRRLIGERTYILFRLHFLPTPKKNEQVVDETTLLDLPEFAKKALHKKQCPRCRKDFDLAGVYCAGIRREQDGNWYFSFETSCGKCEWHFTVTMNSRPCTWRGLYAYLQQQYEGGGDPNEVE